MIGILQTKGESSSADNAESRSSSRAAIITPSPRCRSLRLSEDLPMVIEVVDTEENLEKLIPFLDETVEEGLITLEKVRVIKYRHG